MKISRDLDLVALTALVISLILAAIQIRGCVAGPQIAFVEPKLVSIEPIQYNNRTYYQISAVMSYVNTGAKDQDDIITDEKIVLHFGQELFSYQCASFGDTVIENKRPMVMNEKSSCPVSIAAGKSTSHEAHFVVFPKYDKDGNDIAKYFTEDNLRTAVGSNIYIDIEFFFTTVKKRDTTIKRRIHITKEHFDRLFKKNYVSVPIES